MDELVESKLASGQWKYHPEFPGRKDPMLVLVSINFHVFGVDRVGLISTCRYSVQLTQSTPCWKSFCLQDMILYKVYDEESEIHESEDEKCDGAEHENQDKRKLACW